MSNQLWVNGVVFIRQVSIDQRHGIAAAIDSGVYLADGTDL